MTIANELMAKLEELKPYRPKSEGVNTEDMAISGSLVALILKAEEMGDSKLSTKLRTILKDDLENFMNMDDVFDVLEDMNFHAYAAIADGIRNKASSWKLLALAELAEFQEKVGSAEMATSYLRIALSGSEESRKLAKERGTEVKMSPKLTKLVKTYPKDFQAELKSDYKFTF